MITVNGAFLAGCGALLIAGAAQAYLHFNPKPVGTATVVANATPVPSTTKSTIPTVKTWEDENRADIVKRLAEAGELAAKDPNGAIAKYNEVLSLVSDKRIDDESLRAMLDKAKAERDSLEKIVLAEASEKPTTMVAVAPDPGQPPEVTPPKETPVPDTGPAPEAAKPENIFELPPDTPEALAPALMALSQKKYAEAAEALKNVRATNQPSRDQRLTLETLAAANIGIGQYNLAEGQLKRASDSYGSAGAKVTRSLVLNRALAQLAKRSGTPPQNVAKDLQAYLTQQSGPADETTHAILGTAVSRIDPKVKERPELVNLLNSYTQQLDATRSGDGKRRWGVNWADAEKVDAAQKYVTEVNAQIAALEPKLDVYFKARQTAAIYGTKENIAEAEGNYQKLYGEIHQRRQALLPYQPKWLDKFEPVMPEVVEESSAPAVPVDTPDAPPPPTPEPAQPAQPPAPAPPPPPVP